jgi:hypothetical protein
MGAMRISPFANLAVAAAFLISLGCRPAEDSLHNAAALGRLGFQTLGNGFYLKPGIFLVQLDSAGQVANIITPLDLHGFKYQESDGPYKAIALAPKSLSGERELRLFEENGGCSQFPVSGNGLASCDDPPPSGLFTPDETASRMPLKTRLTKIARLVGPNVYRIADASESQRDFYAVYGQERLIFAGNAQSGRLFAKTKIMGYQRRKDQWAEAEFGALELEGEYIRYELASTGYIVSGSAQQLKEIPSGLTPDQRVTETESSGFHVGGINSNEVIDRMTSLTGKSIEEIEWDGQPGGLSSAGFLSEGENFKDRLKIDNTFVRTHGFTHQQLAAPLFAVMNILDGIADRRFDDFTYGDHRYRANYESYRGFQESLFNDNLQTDRDFTVTNLGTGKTLKFSPLVPYYIARYGFYEGKTDYRVDPEAIIEVFQLRPKG